MQDMISGESDINLFNNEVKTFFSEHFGDEIELCNSKQKNQSAFVFSALLEKKDVINNLRSFDATKTVVAELRKSIRTVNFGLEDKFCDAEERKGFWTSTKTPNQWITLFSELFSIKNRPIQDFSPILRVLHHFHIRLV